MKAEPKKDIQYDLWCPTCKQYTKQAHLEGLEWYCTRCAERHTLEEQGTNETLKAMIELIARDQRIEREILKLTTPHPHRMETR